MDGLTRVSIYLLAACWAKIIAVRIARPVEQANTATAIASSCALHVAEGASVRSPDLLRKETAKAALQGSTAQNLLPSAFP